MPMTIPRAWVAGLLLHAACGPSREDGCGPMQRTLAARGDVRDGGRVVATASVAVREQRGDPAVLDVRVTGARGSSGAPLRGHVRGARLVHANGDTIRDFRIILPPRNGDEVVGTEPASPGDLDAVERMLRRRRGVLLLDTDLPGRERIPVPLTDVQVSRWKRAPCG
jgi:hypothetical protein